MAFLFRNFIRLQYLLTNIRDEMKKLILVFTLFASVSFSQGKLTENLNEDIRIAFKNTFDSLGTQTISVGEGPQRTYPGLWEVPMWGWHDDQGRLIANMDPAYLSCHPAKSPGSLLLQPPDGLK